MAPSAVSGDLAYVDRIFLPIEDTFSWIDVKRFRFEAGRSEAQLLAALIAHVRYRDSYAASDSSEKDSISLHGPYWLAAITLGLFKSAPTDSVVEQLHWWVRTRLDDDPLTLELEAALDASVFGPLRSATSVYTLPDIRPQGQHEWGFVVGGFAGFHEFIMINQEVQELLLIVASDD